MVSSDLSSMPPVSTIVNFAPPLGVGIQAVARNARPVFGYGNFSARDFVEEGALPHIRAADDGDQRIAHDLSVPLAAYAAARYNSFLSPLLYKNLPRL